MDNIDNYSYKNHDDGKVDDQEVSDYIYQGEELPINVENEKILMKCITKIMKIDLSHVKKFITGRMGRVMMNFQKNASIQHKYMILFIPIKYLLN